MKVSPLTHLYLWTGKWFCTLVFEMCVREYFYPYVFACVYAYWHAIAHASTLCIEKICVWRHFLMLPWWFWLIKIQYFEYDNQNCHFTTFYAQKGGILFTTSKYRESPHPWYPQNYSCLNAWYAGLLSNNHIATYADNATIASTFIKANSCSQQAQPYLNYL